MSIEPTVLMRPLYQLFNINYHYHISVCMTAILCFPTGYQYPQQTARKQKSKTIFFQKSFGF